MKKGSLVLCLALLSGCGSGVKDGDSSAVLSANIVVPSGVTASSYLPRPLVEFFQLNRSGGDLVMRSAGDVGNAATSDVLSLKYHFFAISICQSMSTNGTAFSNPTNCLSVYDSGTTNQSGTWSYDTNNISAASMVQTLQNNASDVIDLIDSTSRAKLTTGVKLKESDAGSYNWGTITWYPAIAVKGKVTLGNGTILRTLGGTFNGSQKWITSSAMTSGTPADAYSYTGNGGTWFRFQNPLVITKDDINSGAPITVDLAFNPNAYFKGVNSTTYAGCGTCSIGDSSNNWMTVPMLDITPIPHKSTDTVMRDTYVATITGGTLSSYQLRVQFYYLKNDPSKTVYGVNTNTLFNSSTTGFIYDLSKISFIETNADGSLNLQIWDKSNLIENFTRKSNLNETTTATVRCGSLNGGGWSTADCSSGSTINATFTLTESGALVN